jgi:SPP1 gp7 family putative phage head morphogenesis protein
MAVAVSQVAAAIQARRAAMGGRRRTLRLKRPPVWRDPAGIERSYTRMVLQAAAQIEEAVRRMLLPQLPSLVEEARSVRPDSRSLPVSQRQDGWVERAAALTSALTTSLAARTEDVSAVALDIGQKTSQWNSAQWQKILKTTLAVDVFQAEPYLRDQLKSFASENTRLITKMTDEAIGEIDGIVQRGISGGRRVEDIAKEIRERFQVTRRKAKLIARDQVAKLNSQLTQLRQTNLGVSKYVWRTSKDERVRTSHKVMEGKTAVWDDATVYLDDKGKRHPRSGIGGVELHPGEDFQCRCFAEPVLGDLLPEEAA